MCVTKKQKRKTKYHFVTLHLQNDKKKTFPFELWVLVLKVLVVNGDCKQENETKNKNTFLCKK